MSETSGLDALRGLHVEPGILQLDPKILLAIAAGLLLSIVAMVFWRSGYFHRQKVRQAALAALAAAQSLPAEQRLAEQAKLLRRIARTIGGEEIARLHGEAWLGALDRLFQTRFFTSEQGRCFADGLYAASAAGASDTTAVRLEALIRALRP